LLFLQIAKNANNGTKEKGQTNMEKHSIFCGEKTGIINRKCNHRGPQRKYGKYSDYCPNLLQICKNNKSAIYF